MSDENDNGTDGGGIKDLRKQYDAMKKSNDELVAELKTLRAEKRHTSVAEVLKAKGLPEKAARFYDGDDVSPDAVGKWLDEYGDVFGLKKQEQGGQPDPNAQAAQRISDASFGAPEQGVLHDGQVIGDPEQLLHLMKTLPYEELQKLNMQPKSGGLYGR